MTDNLFRVHRLNEIGLAGAGKLAEHFSDLLRVVESYSGTEGRDIALVRTHLQLACFYAKRALAEHPENQLIDL
jgi:hypothetical protein